MGSSSSHVVAIYNTLSLVTGHRLVVPTLTSMGVVAIATDTTHTRMNMPFTFLSRGWYVRRHSYSVGRFSHSHLLLVFTSGPFLAPFKLSRACSVPRDLRSLLLIGIRATLFWAPGRASHRHAWLNLRAISSAGQE
jgi:hypothetical protein